MHSFLKTTLIALAALGLIAAPADAAPKSHVKEKGHFTLSASLQPSVAAPVGSSGTAVIEVEKEKFKSTATAELTLNTTGLAAGTYSLDATMSDAITVHITEFTVTGSAPEAPVVVALPSTVDAGSIASLSVSDATMTVILEGEIVAESVTWKFIANVRVTGPELVATKGKKVRGHVVAHSFIKESVETKRHLLFVAFGGPKETELTINVDGVAVGTVMSSKQGKVSFHEIDPTVVLRDMKLITITDALGTVLMQAAF